MLYWVMCFPASKAGRCIIWNVNPGLHNKVRVLHRVTDLGRRHACFSPPIPEARGGFPEARGGLPELRGGLPEARGGVPELRGVLPQARGGFLEARGGLPGLRGGLPELRGGLPECPDRYSELSSRTHKFRAVTYLGRDPLLGKDFNRLLFYLVCILSFTGCNNATG